MEVAVASTPLPVALPPVCSPRFVHHVELQTPSARVMASFLAGSLGMQVASQLRTGRGFSYGLQSGQAVIVCSAVHPNTTVRAIGLQVEQPHSLEAHVVAMAGAQAVSSSRSLARTDIRMPDCLGDLRLRLVVEPLTTRYGLPGRLPPALPGFEPLAGAVDAPPVPGGVIAIDHVAINTPDIPALAQRLQSALGWSHFRTFEERHIGQPLSAATLASHPREGLLTLVQPTSRRSMFQRALDLHEGVSVHHVALRCADVVQLADHLWARGRWNCMPAPPDSYYQQIRRTALDYVDEATFERMRRYGMLLDATGECALIQVFLPRLDDVPGVFFELIGRVPHRDDAATELAAPGCGGFGDGNVTRLYDCLVRGMDAAPRAGDSKGAV